jgi:lipopolysaccharide transport system ATP-binding protein
MNPIVSVQRMSKAYRIRSTDTKRYHTLRDELAALALNLVTGKTGEASFKTFWALQDISFDIMPGEMVGIIGRNGAGKSTLLKILSRITRPTQGTATLDGRVVSLLEVGTGFHPELTGRENIFISGAVLGMKRPEICKKFDEIVAFAEVEAFLDVPVKRYSSGMYVRLAFAVAAHLDPEILLIDEVLAVGDAAFQKKCLGKMEHASRQDGRTVVFVSHNMVAVQTLCQRGLWLNQGQLKQDGAAGEVIAAYLQHDQPPTAHELVWPNLQTAPGNDQVRIHRVCARSTDSTATLITISSPLVIEFEYWNFQPEAYLNLSLFLYNEQGVMILNSAPTDPSFYTTAFTAGLFRSSCFIPGDLLNDGTHYIDVLVVQDQGIVIYRHDRILSVDILDAVERRGAWYDRWPGAVRPALKWHTEKVLESANG